MDHHDHVALLRGGVRGQAENWADIGAGSGAFTLALAELLGPGGWIVAVDRDAGALHENAATMAARYPDVTLRTLVGDLTGSLDLAALDGLVAANSLHFVPRDRQVEVIRRLAGHLRPGGLFLVVEYDADRGNPWIPHPFSVEGWRRSSTAAGLVGMRPLGRVPSRFLGAIYSALAQRPNDATSRSTSDESL